MRAHRDCIPPRPLANTGHSQRVLRKHSSNLPNRRRTSLRRNSASSLLRIHPTASRKVRHHRISSRSNRASKDQVDRMASLAVRALCQDTADLEDRHRRQDMVCHLTARRQAKASLQALRVRSRQARCL